MKDARSESTYTSFCGDKRIVTGTLEEMLRATWRRVCRGEHEPVSIFDDDSGKQVDFDFRGTADEVVARALSARGGAPSSGPGRPKLGVVAREVTLLPRHWDWLEQQPNGASAMLRRLVDEARKREPEKERARRARDAASRFMTAIAGNRPGYEEALRVLFAGDREALSARVRSWPRDIREHLDRMLDGSGSAAAAANHDR